MKVLLIFPPKGFTSKDPLPSLGLISLAAVLEKEGIDVQVIDASVENLSWAQLKKRIKESNSQIIGITCLTEFRFQSFKSARIAKDISPESWIIIGGPHPSFSAEDTLLNYPEMDIVVRGEAEYTLLDICRAYEGRLNLEDIAGISYRKEGKIYNNPPSTFIEDLDSLPFPARHLLCMEKYNFRLFVPGKGWRQATHLITSRGCPFGCSFCITSQMSGRIWRARSPENIIAEIEDIIHSTGLRTIWFYDDIFNLSKERVRKICDLIIKKNLKIDFVCSVRVDTIDRELLEVMKQAGCFKVFFGVESGSPRIQEKACNNKASINKVRQLSTWLDELKIVKNPGYILGFPDETLKDAQMTMDLMQEIGGQISLSFLRIYPGTEIEEEAKERNILSSDYSWSKIRRQKNISVAAAHGQAPLFIDKLRWNELSNFAMEWAICNKVSFRKRIPRAVREIREWDDVKHLWIMGKKYVEKKAYHAFHPRTRR